MYPVFSRRGGGLFRCHAFFRMAAYRELVFCSVNYLV